MAGIRAEGFIGECAADDSKDNRGMGRSRKVAAD